MGTLNHQQQQEKFTVTSMDESFFFFYDSLVRRVWISKNERPAVVKITGSSRLSQFCLVLQV
jgi:hypothetical protein